MIWTAELFMVFITTLTAGLSLLIWRALEKVLIGHGADRIACGMLACVVSMHLIPVGYMVMDVLAIVYNGRSRFLQVAFMTTPFMYYLSIGLIAVWIVGMIWHLREYLLSIYDLYKLRKLCMPADKEERDLLRKCIGRTGLKRRVDVFKSYVVSTPILTGVLFPKILLPADRKYTRDELECVLIHELMHVRNGDLILKKLALIAEDIHWFNPITQRLLLKSVNEWTEYRCDESTCSDYIQRKTYYEVLLSSAVIQKSQAEYHNTALLESGSQVLRRVKYMESSKKAIKPGRAASVLVTCVFLLINTTVALAAGIGSVAIHRPIYDATLVSIQEELMPLPEYDEVLGYVDFSTVQEGAVLQNVKGTKVYFCWAITPGMAKKSPTFTKNSGDTIRIIVQVDPAAAYADVGIVKPNGSQVYVTGNDIIVHDFNITQTGTYRIFIRNNSSGNITADGYYQ